MLRGFRFYSSSTKLKYKGRNSDKKKWILRQIRDPFVKRANTSNYRCRSAFKLIEIDDKYRLFKPGFLVIDLGAAPGSWSQVAVTRVQPEGEVIGLDLQFFDPIPGVTLLHGMDFTQAASKEAVINCLNGRPANIVLSDMMVSNLTGVKSIDDEKIFELCSHVVDFSADVLITGGSLLLKLWHGSQERQLMGRMTELFNSVRRIKPQASRDSSAEFYILGRDFV